MNTGVCVIACIVPIDSCGRSGSNDTSEALPSFCPLPAWPFTSIPGNEACGRALAGAGSELVDVFRCIPVAAMAGIVDLIRAALSEEPCTLFVGDVFCAAPCTFWVTAAPLGGVVVGALPTAAFPTGGNATDLTAPFVLLVPAHVLGNSAVSPPAPASVKGELGERSKPTSSLKSSDSARVCRPTALISKHSSSFVDSASFTGLFSPFTVLSFFRSIFILPSAASRSPFSSFNLRSASRTLASSSLFFSLCWSNEIQKSTHTKG